MTVDLMHTKRQIMLIIALSTVAGVMAIKADLLLISVIRISIIVHCNVDGYIRGDLTSLVIIDLAT